MLRPLITALITFAALYWTSAPNAAFDVETAALPHSSFELVVVEVEGCIYCQIFRRDVVPAYTASQRAREVPLRFVDLNQPDAGKLALTGPIDEVPTAILFKHHREVGRIAGYVGPEAFFHSINRLMAQSQ